jgi:hypothetical protein
VAWVASPGQKAALKKLILVKNKNKNMLERARARSISKDYLKRCHMLWFFSLQQIIMSCAA